MKECKTCKVEFEGNYVNCDSCRKKRAEYMSNYYHNSNGNPNRKFRSKVPESFTKDCKMCGETFTTGNVRGSHQYKYCNDCNCKNAYNKSEKGRASRKACYLKNGRAAGRAWYLKNKPPAAKPVETECPTCKTIITNKKNSKGHGGYKKYCNPECYPAKVKARELREKQRREGKNCQWCGKHIGFENATDNQLRVFKAVKFCNKTCCHHHRLSIPRNALSARFRSEMWHVMKRNPINGIKNQYDPNTPKGFGVLGYSKEELISHIVAQFEEGMTLDNYGEWHIDHIKPVSKFEFEKTSDKGFKECFALENLQPLWAKHNIKKGAKEMEG